MIDIGSPRPSTARWISLVRPARDRPRASPATARSSTHPRWHSPLFPGPTRVLVGPDGGGVDAEGPLHVPDGVVLDDDLVQDAFPSAVRGPDPQPFMRGFPRAVALGQVAPRGSGAQLPQDRVDHLAVITPPPAPALHRRQQWLDPGPCFLCQLATAYHQDMITDTRSEPLQDTP
jgi:hypothetical protein